jgi:hypothetical protein
MEINMNVSKAIETRRCTTIMDKATLLDKGIRILDLDEQIYVDTDETKLR